MALKGPWNVARETLLQDRALVGELPCPHRELLMVAAGVHRPQFCQLVCCDFMGKTLVGCRQIAPRLVSSRTARTFSAPDQNFSMPFHSGYQIVSSQMSLYPFSQKF